MKIRYLLVFILFISGIVFAKLDLSAGIGSSFMAQEYITFDYDSTDLLEKDTLSFSNKFKATFDLDYKKRIEDGYFKSRLYTSIGSNSFFNKGSISSDFDFGKAELVLKDYLEFTIPWDNDDYTKGYVKNKIVSELGYPLPYKFEIEGGFSIENKLYSKNTESSKDYNIFKFSTYLEYDKELILNYKLSNRLVPDSTEANYYNHSIALSFDKYITRQKTASMYAELNHRKFPDYEDENYSKLYIDAAPQFPLGEKFALRPYYELEIYEYKTSSITNIDYNHHKIGLAIPWYPGLYSEVSIGCTGLFAFADEDYEGETYAEIGFPVNVNIFKSKTYFLNSEISFGWRYYEGVEESDYSFYSDYFYTDLSIIGNYYITEKLKLSAFASYSPEWHQVSADDFTLTYISINLKYEFK